MCIWKQILYVEGCRERTGSSRSGKSRCKSRCIIDRPSRASGPNLVDIVVSTFPNLYLIGVGNVAICEIEAETLKTISDPVTMEEENDPTLVSQSNSIIGSIEPILSWKVVKALPNFYSDAVGRI